MASNLKKDLQLVGKELKALIKKVESIQKQISSPSKPKTAKSKPAKSKSVKKRATRKAPAKKAAAKKSDTAVATALAVISRYKKGADTATLMKKTGYDRKKVANLVFKLKKQGRIKSDKKGIYLKA
jgi:hypothetical protein